MNYTINHVKTILNATSANVEDATITQVATDSRSLHLDENTLFFCLVGDIHDGHDYVDELIAKGVKHFVVSKALKIQQNINFLKVENTTVALQTLAKHHREQFDLPVLAITGSNGKTIVKEWLNYLISPEYHVVRSPKSFNSQIGVPLSLLTINAQHNFGIIEAGISQTNEMEKLEAIIQPTLGLLTNIGTAHDEGFSSKGEKIKEKLKLFKNIDTFIGEYVENIISKLPSKTKTFTWSFEDKHADIMIIPQNLGAHHRDSFLVVEGENSQVIKLPFSDEASIQNAFHSLTVMRYLNYDYEVISQRLEQLFPLNMRLELKQGINNTLLIDDSYSADYQSLKIALDTLENQKQHPQKTVILSDIFQSGKDENDLYQEVYHLLQLNQVNRIFVIGEKISQFLKAHKNVKTFQSTADFLENIDQCDFKDESILIKGARIFAFEKIVQRLQFKEHETRLEINLNALSYNYHFYKAKLKKSTKIMAMIKAFGYGNGGIEIAKELIHNKVNYLGVAYADEGIMLRLYNIKVPIMVLNPEINTYEKMLNYDLEPEIYNLRGLIQFSKLAKAFNKKNYPIHIKIDTGMHRLGFNEAELNVLIAELKHHNHLKITSLLSHLVASDNPDFKDFTLNQIKKFKILAEKLSHAIGYQPLMHILNTSGIAHYPEAQFDMVRLGLGVYGITNDLIDRQQLQLVATLKSVISQMKTIEKGDSVSYNRTFIATKTMQIATIPIGYADGVRRILGNGNYYVLINDKKANILGTICMDMMMVDVSEINCQAGDEVIIFGEKPTIYDMAERANTITYEIMTGISQRVERVFFRE